MRQTSVLPFSDDAIEQAARVVADGRPVAVATETVYGLAADATNPVAVARIYQAKGRPSFNPLIVHVATPDDAERLGMFDDAARMLAARHWPGPLTLVVPARADNGIAALATAGLRSIALRVPRHRAMRALLDRSGRPLAAPSANASGRVSPTRAEHVLLTLGGRIDLIVDDGPCPVGLESTIVAATGGPLRLLRSGAIVLDGVEFDGSDTSESPGRLASHYAPAKPLRLEAVERHAGEYLIGFGEVEGDCNLSPTGNLVEAAGRLFECLHLADASAATAIAVAPVPARGVGVAIDDRLRRAAA